MVDGHSVPRQTWEPAAPASAAGIPMIVGTCKDESTLFSANDPGLFSLRDEDLPARLVKAGIPEADATALLAACRRDHPRDTPTDTWFRISSDRGARHRADRTITRSDPVASNTADYTADDRAGRSAVASGDALALFDHVTVVGIGILRCLRSGKVALRRGDGRAVDGRIIDGDAVDRRRIDGSRVDRRTVIRHRRDRILALPRALVGTRIARLPAVLRDLNMLARERRRPKACSHGCSHKSLDKSGHRVPLSACAGRFDRASCAAETQVNALFSIVRRSEPSGMAPLCRIGAGGAARSVRRAPRPAPRSPRHPPYRSARGAGCRDR